MKNLIKGIMNSLIFLGGISSVAAKTESLPKTQALIHLENCFRLVRNPKASVTKITSEFMSAIKDKGDDPGCFDKLEKIARELGATERTLQQMWCEYGLTDEGHEFFSKQPRSSKDDKTRLVTAIRSALSE